MATTNKDFIVKNGLVVQGAQGTINGEVIVTEASLGTSLGSYIELSEKGSIDGVATLDESGQVPLSQLGNAPSGGGGEALTIGTGLSGTSYNGSTPVTIAIDSTVATLTGSQTLSNKTIDGANNTLTVRLANDVTGTLPVANGGTGKTSATAALANLMGYTTTATAAGTTILDNTSSHYQVFTGTTTQTVRLPVTSTLQTGWTFNIINNSTGTVTVQSSGGNTVIAIISGTAADITCIGTGLTTAADWEFGLTHFSTYTGSGAVVLASSPAIDTINAGSSAFTGTLWSNITGGAIGIGAGQTTGNLNIGSGTARTTGAINIGTGITTTGTKTINVGTGSTGGTTAITVGSSSGATSNITINGNVTLPSTTSIGNVSSTEIGYVDGVTSAIQTQIDSKAPLASPTFTGTVTLPSGTVTSTMIADGTIVAGDIADGAITSGKILDGTIVNADINASAAIALSKLATDPLARANHTGTQTASTISDFDTQVRTNRLDQMAVPTADVSLNSRKITNLATPTNSTDAVTKSYVDAAVEGLHVHASVKVATTANVALATALENGDTLDGVTLVTGDRILVKNQTTQSENGIYIVQVSGQPSRATDFDTAAEVDSGDFVFVDQGTTQANTGWVQINTPAVIGTNAIEFVQFSGAGTYTAGNGLTLTGTVFSINTATTVDINTAQTLTNKTLTSPTLTTPALGVATGTSFNSITGLSSTTPSANGTAAVGTATTTARADHVHPTTGLGLTASGLNQFAATTSSQLASVISDETGSGALVFATSPTLVTPSLGVATGTSFNSITGLSSTTPIVNGTAAVGTAVTVARADHVHPTDTSRAPLAAPTFTGTVTLPSTTSIGNVSSTEIGYLDGVTSAIQTQLDAKVPKSDYSAKGRILVGTGASTYTSLAVGATNGHVLKVDSAQTSGVVWGTTPNFSITDAQIGSTMYVGTTTPSTPAAGDVWIDESSVTGVITWGQLKALGGIASGG